MKERLICAVFIWLALASSVSFAQDERAAGIEQRLNEAQARLSLSEAQAEALAPVLEASMAAQQRVRSKYGIDPDRAPGAIRSLGRRDAMEMKRELDAVRRDMLNAVEDILDDEQFDEF